MSENKYEKFNEGLSEMCDSLVKEGLCREYRISRNAWINNVNGIALWVNFRKSEDISEEFTGTISNHIANLLRKSGFTEDEIKSKPCHTILILRS
jgi:hypothetical protein